VPELLRDPLKRQNPTGRIPVLNELTAGIVARLSGNRAHPLLHPVAAARWIRNSSRLDADERLSELLAHINAFNAEPNLNVASLQALLLVDAAAARALRALTESYLAGNRTANKAMLKRIDDAARSLGATYELFLRGHKAARPLLRNQPLLAHVLLGMFHYRNVQNRVRLFRYEEPPPAAWQATNSLYRYAMVSNVHRVVVRAPHRDGKPATVESDYATLLLVARLASGSFTAQEIDHAATLLDDFQDRLRLISDEPAHATFALDLDSSAGLVSAHGIHVTDRVLFLDPEPLFAQIRKRMADIGADESGDALARKVRIAWLERLIAHWAPDRKIVSRRADREVTDTHVALVPGLHNIHRELMAEMENAGEFWDTLIRTGRWRIVEASPLDCRIQFENESADQYPVGALVSIRKEAAPDWQAGVVRRVKRYDAGRIELGIEMIAREVKAIRLWPEIVERAHPTLPLGPLTPSLPPDPGAMIALYLPSSGAIPPAPSRALILRHSDYKPGMIGYYVSGDTRVTLKLGEAIETGRGWVWTTFTVEGRTPDGGQPRHAVPQGITTQIPSRSKS
jgi:hypothetical protein